MKEKFEYYIAEDHTLLRQGLIQLLDRFNFSCAGEACNGVELLALLEKKEPDLILLDIRMPEKDGNQTLPVIKEKYPQARVVVLTEYAESCLKEDMINKGADAFLSKSVRIEQLTETMLHIVRNKKRPLRIGENKSTFTKREREIIPLLCEGKTSVEIASTLNIAEKTVEANRTKLFFKTGSRTFAHFIRHCIDKGFQYLGNSSDRDRRELK